MKRSRENSLDILKAIAIIGIVLHHCNSFGFFPNRKIGEFFGSMWLLVDLFFVISGYLFYSKLICFDVSFRTFASRYINVLPLYYLFMVLAYCGKRLAMDGSLSFRFHYLFLVQNYLDPMPFYNISWFLCVLEQGLLVLFVVNRFLKKSSVFAMCALIILAVLPTLVRIFFVPMDAERWGIFYTSALTHSDGLVIGAILSVFVRRHRFEWPKFVYLSFVALAVVYVIIFQYFSTAYHVRISYWLNSVIFAVLVFGGKGVFDHLRIGFLEKISKIGYVVFLAHPLVLQALSMSFARRFSLNNVIIVLFVVFGFSYIVFLIHGSFVKALLNLYNKKASTLSAMERE